LFLQQSIYSNKTIIIKKNIKKKKKKEKKITIFIFIVYLAFAQR